MDILAQAKKLDAQGKDIIHLEVAEPDFNTPQPIIDAGIKTFMDENILTELIQGNLKFFSPEIIPP